MKIVSPFTTKQISECAAGELFEFNFQGQSAFGLCLESSDGSPLWAVAIASHVPGFTPTIFEVNDRWDGLCLSYGPSAVIELMRDDDLALSDFARSEWPGTIRTSEAELAIRCHDLDKRRANWIDLRTLTFAKNHSSGEQAYVANWRLWADERDMHTSGRTPLVTVIAAPRQPA